jgi:hypothetical protein
MKDRDLKKSFDMPLEEYQERLAKQNGVCAICKKPETLIRLEKLTALRVDHSHLTGANRGLLCDSCNKGIGFLKDSPELCIAAAQYLRSYE